MLKRIIALITALFLNGCTTTQEYIQISAEEFKEELINLSKYNDKTKNCIWVYVISDSEESQNYLYFQLNCFNLEKQNSVINVIKRVKINNKEIKLKFEKENSMATKRVSLKDIEIIKK